MLSMTSATLAAAGTSPKKMYYGIYLGSVVSSQDPDRASRVTLKVPQILGSATSNWAVPLGLSISSVPTAGTLVHVQFLGGDVNHPIYFYNVSD